MNKTDLINKIARTEGLTKTKAAALLDNVFNNITDELKAGGEVFIPNFGTFKVKDKAERNVRNPQTGEIMTAPAKKAVHFSASNSLKEGVQWLSTM